MDEIEKKARELPTTPTEEALRVIGLCERATPGSFTIKYGVNIMAGDDLAATTLSRSSDDATERNMANAAALVEAVNFARAHLPDLLAENKRLRRDAERYRFIASDHSAAWEEELDAAIDAAWRAG